MQDFTSFQKVNITSDIKNVNSVFNLRDIEIRNKLILKVNEYYQSTDFRKSLVDICRSIMAMKDCPMKDHLKSLIISLKDFMSGINAEGVKINAQNERQRQYQKELVEFNQRKADYNNMTDEQVLSSF